MKKKTNSSLVLLLPVLAVACLLFACGGNSAGKAGVGEQASAGDPDTAFYGSAVVGTSKTKLLVVTDLGDTLRLKIVPDYASVYDEEDGEEVTDDTEALFLDDDATVVAGGIPQTGDRVTVVGFDTSEGRVATMVVNISSLYGEWSSIDKQFEICEGGVVKASAKDEHAAWTDWKLHNCNLILGADTFGINTITPDTLLLENRRGIYAYSRK